MICVAVAALTGTAGTIAAYRGAPQDPLAGQRCVLQPAWLSPHEGEVVGRGFDCLIASLPGRQEGDVVRIVELMDGRVVAVLGEMPLLGGPAVQLDYDIRCHAPHLGPIAVACRVYRSGLPISQSEPLHVVVEN